MASYVVPQVEIHQLFSEIPVALAQNQVAFVFGPNYLLHRYDDPSMKKSITTTTEFRWKDGVKTFYEGALDEDAIDTKSGYTKLYGDNVLVKLQLLGEECTTFVTSDGYDAIITDDIAIDSLKRIPVKGDHIFLRTSSDGDGTVINDYDMLVREVEEVTDSSSSTQLKIIFENTFDTSSGLTYEAYLCELRDGVEFVQKAYDTDGNKVLNWTEKDVAISGKTAKGVEASDLYTEIYDPEYRFSYSDGKTSVNWGEVVKADLYVEFRELLTSYSDTVHSALHASEVEELLGTISPDNPLAQAVYNAALNSGGQVVRFMAVKTDDLQGYNDVLNSITLTKQVYFLVPATRDGAVLDAVQSHVNAMSANPNPGQKAVKRWRIAFISAEIPDEDPIYTQASHPQKKDYLATFTKIGTGTTSATWKLVVDADFQDDVRFNRDLRKNDIIRTGSKTEWGKTVPLEGRITKIVNNFTLEIKFDEPVALVTNPGQKFEAYHPYTAAETAELVRNISSSFRDRRMYNIYPTHFTGGGVLQTGEFAAAAVAGLVSSCLPQQPVTNMELVGIDDIPLVYQTFSYDELDTMASGGTFIVMQDLPGDQVYVRHQISTDYESNNLNTAELSITKNLDSISYFFDDLTSPYIGKYNITPELIETLRNVITNGLTSLETSSYGLYGPQVIADGTSILLLEQDALLKDHVNCNLQLNLPYPFNHLVLKLFV